jgi:probable rRNA maturation factor
MKALSKKSSLKVPISAREPAVESELLFQHRSRKVRRTELRVFWKELTQRIAPHSAAACLITGDEELRRMNREFRHKDYATDVLSFPSDIPALGDSVSLDIPALADGASGMLGEIAISFDRAAAQAAELGHSVDEELRILMLHGLLHLTGLDHEADSGEMARVETRWRKKLGLPLGLIERSEKAARR